VQIPFYHYRSYCANSLVFANAGIIQKEHYYDEEPLVVSSDGFESPPIPAFLMTAKVNFIGTLQTAYLAQHYLARNGGGSLIFTASSGSLYPSAAVPVYSASKHGVLGFAQSIAKYSWEEKNIRVNSLCPGTIITGLTGEKNWARFPKAHLTPMKKLVDVVGILLDDPTIHGKAVEISGLNHYFHSPRTPVDESMVVAVDRVQSRSFL
jgi:NAD(P)-dependent dehydrogenase (short-subunit alcohol dehydrogenase family)